MNTGFWPLNLSTKAFSRLYQRIRLLSGRMVLRTPARLVIWGSNYMQQHPFIFSDERKFRIGRHLAFWAAWWIFQGFLYSFVAIDHIWRFVLRLPTSMVESLIFLLVHVFLSYSLMYFVIPRFLLKGRYALTTAWVVCLFLLAGVMS